MAHTCATVWASMSRRVSRATFFEMGFSRTVPDDTGASVLCPSLRVGGCYMHPLSDTVSVNDTTWAWEGQCLDKTRMDGCLGNPDEMSDTWAHDMTERVVMADDILRLEMAPRHMNHVDGDRDDKMRCDVVLRDLGPNRGKVELNDLA